jgi:septal ring factor EnvC (AmiA/AmiB activator)
MLFALGKIEGKIDAALGRLSEISNTQREHDKELKELSQRMTTVEADQSSRLREHEANTKAISQLIADHAETKVEREVERKAIEQRAKFQTWLVSFVTACSTAAIGVGLKLIFGA